MTGKKFRKFFLLQTELVREHIVLKHVYKGKSASANRTEFMSSVRVNDGNGKALQDKMDQDSAKSGAVKEKRLSKIGKQRPFYIVGILGIVS